MRAIYQRAQHAQQRSAARVPARIIALLSVAAAALLVAPLSIGDAILTTQTVKVDNKVDTVPTVQNWGAFDSQIRPHLGTTFSDGSQGYLRFSMYDGWAVPQPVPVVNSGDSIEVKVELPASLKLDRTSYLRGPAHNWCAGILPTHLREVFGTPTCTEQTHSNGASSISLILTPDRTLTADIFTALNDLRLGFGVQGTPASVDGEDTAHINVLFPHATERPRIAEAGFRTSARPGSTLGIWNFELVNQTASDLVDPTQWRHGNTGVARFSLTPDGTPVRMKTGETFSFSLSLFHDDNAHIRVTSDPSGHVSWCDDFADPGFEVLCEIDDPSDDVPGYVGFTAEITRVGPDTDDAFTAGALIEVPVEAVASAATAGNASLSMWSELTQAGSANTHATAPVALQPALHIPDPEPVKDFKADHGGSVVFAPDGKKAYASVRVGPTSAVRIIDVASNKQTGSISGILVMGRADKLAVTPDGRWLYVAYHAGGIGVVDLQTDTQIGVVAGFSGGAGPKKALSLSPDGSRLWVASSGSTLVQVIDTATNVQVDELDANRPVEAFVFAPDGNTAYVAYGSDGRGSRPGIAVVDVATLTVTDRVVPASPWSGATTLTLNKDGSLLYAGVLYAITIIDTRTLAYRHSTGEGTRDVLAFALSPDDTYGLLSSAYTESEKLHIFDTRREQIVGSVEGFTGRQASSIQFAPDGSKAYVMSHYGTILSVLTPSGSISPDAE